MTRTKNARTAEAVRMLARLTRMVEQACQEGGLSLPQYRLLLYIGRTPQRAGDVASKTAVSRPALTGLVDGLEKKGLLRRASVEGDRRGISLELTSEGNEALERAEEYLIKRMDEIQERIGDTGLVTALADLRAALDREAERRAGQTD
jgi:DNA-binding MarR family transcriptional regulator